VFQVKFVDEWNVHLVLIALLQNFNSRHSFVYLRTCSLEKGLKLKALRVEYWGNYFGLRKIRKELYDQVPHTLCILMDFISVH
jgi:hypothetical protein